MRATCTNCGSSWELQKEPDDYADGPRCSECGEYDPEIDVESASNGEVSEVFRALAEGAEPAGLVIEHGVDPEAVETHLDHFERLSSYHVLTGEALAEHDEAVREEVREEWVDRVESARERERQRVESEKDAECETTMDALAEEYEAKMDDLAVGFEAELDQLREEFEAAVEAERADAAQAHEEAWVEAMEAAEAGDVAAAYLAGLRAVPVGLGAELTEAGKMEVLAAITGR